MLAQQNEKAKSLLLLISQYAKEDPCQKCIFMIHFLIFFIKTIATSFDKHNFIFIKIKEGDSISIIHDTKGNVI